MLANDDKESARAIFATKQNLLPDQADIADLLLTSDHYQVTVGEFL